MDRTNYQREELYYEKNNKKVERVKHPVDFLTFPYKPYFIKFSSFTNWFYVYKYWYQGNFFTTWGINY